LKKLDREKQALKSAGIELLDRASLKKEIINFKKNKFSRSPESRRAKRYVIDQLIARGYKRYEIAKKLNLSDKTIYNLLNANMKNRLKLMQ